MPVRLSGSMTRGPPHVNGGDGSLAGRLDVRVVALEGQVRDVIEVAAVRSEPGVSEAATSFYGDQTFQLIELVVLLQVANHVMSNDA